MKKYSAATVAVVQASPVIFDAERTLEKIKDLTADAAARGAALVLFPEAFVSAYPKGSAFGSEPAQGMERTHHPKH